MRKALYGIGIAALLALNALLTAEPAQAGGGEWNSQDDWLCGDQGAIQVCTNEYFAICGNDEGGPRPDCS
ncbi:MAG: hypothetical protein RQ745_07295 [Longimicrobiales bacterium]|nr:hypothetical protein [Longimicrobiales bacterium]